MIFHNELNEIGFLRRMDAEQTSNRSACQVQYLSDMTVRRNDFNAANIPPEANYCQSNLQCYREEDGD